MRTLLCAAVFSVCLLNAGAAEFTYNEIVYTITGEATCEVGRQSPAAITGDIELPSSAIDPADSKSYEVTSISGFAFVTCSTLSGITIPATVTTIGNSSFSKCTSLETVRFLGTPVSVGSNCFSESSTITAVYTPDFESWISTDFNGASANPLYYGATLYCNDGTPAETGIIPAGTKRIGNYSLAGIKTLEKISLPEGFEEIGKGAFEGCPLTSVEIPSLADWCAISFGNYTANPLYGGTAVLVQDGKEITELDIPEGVSAINNYAFMNYTAATSITIPGSVTTIGAQSFSGCTSAKTLTLGEGVGEVGMNAFQKIDFTLVTSQAATPPRLGSKAFSDATYAEASLITPPDTSDLYKAATGWKNFKKISESSTTGIENIFPDAAVPVKYFNLQGIEVTNPAKGIYIRQHGEKTEKIMAR